MARVIVFIHEFDRFTNWRWPFAPRGLYMLYDVLRALEKFGHSWRVVAGPSRVPGDVALLHVDATLVGEEYLALRDYYPRTVNFGTGDISKRQVSNMLLARGDQWDGPVIVKSDLNCFGASERTHNKRARRAGRPIPHPHLPLQRPYRVLNGVSDVQAEVWNDPHLVVERFVPERDADGSYAIRRWVFMGPRERCTRQVTMDAVSRAGRVIRLEHVEVPDKLRSERERLGFDYGKFDFVIHDGEPVLIDANRTPGVARAVNEMVKSGARNLAEGLDALIRE